MTEESKLVLYYRVLADDRDYANRWFLDEPRTERGEELDSREFTYGRRYLGLLPANVPIQYAGREVQFNLAAFDMPVVSSVIAHIVEEIAPGQVECFPVKIDASLPGYAILNVIRQEACVDEKRSSVTFWSPEDGHPDRVGRYRMISDLTIDPTRVAESHIFRVEDFEVALLVSDRLKVALDELQDLGITFRPVC